VTTTDLNKLVSNQRVLSVWRGVNVGSRFTIGRDSDGETVLRAALAASPQDARQRLVALGKRRVALQERRREERLQRLDVVGSWGAPREA
jgi:hypothetical protein